MSRGRSQTRATTSSCTSSPLQRDHREHIRTRPVTPEPAVPARVSRTPSGIGSDRWRPRPPSAAGEDQPGQLADEERVAAAAPPHRLGPLVRRAGPRHDGHQRWRRRPAQRERAAARARPSGAAPRRPRCPGTRRAPGPRDADTLSGDELQQPQGRVVGPVQVVEDHHQRRVAGEPAQRAGDRVEQPELGVRRVLRRFGLALAPARPTAGSPRRARRVRPVPIPRSTWVQGQYGGAPAPSQHDAPQHPGAAARRVPRQLARAARTCRCPARR